MSNFITAWEAVFGMILTERETRLRSRLQVYKVLDAVYLYIFLS